MSLAFVAAALLLAACAPGAAPLPIANGYSGAAERLAPEALAGRILALHNAERARVGNRPIAWDPALADGAGRYADELAHVGALRHSAKSARPGQGENLWMGSRGAYSVEQMVGSWLSERSRFRAGVFPDVSSDGDWSHVGHFSAMIWPGSTRVGCAIRSSARDDYLVCRYAPAGNVTGRRVP